MDITGVSKILKKINRLYELVNDIGEASTTEKDLLKAYVLDLYEAVTAEDADEITDMEEKEMLKKIKKQRKLEKKLKKKNHVTVIDDEIEEPPAPEPAPATVQRQPAAEPVKIKEAAKPAISGALTELFEINNGNEISDKLSQAPIQDLTKAMSINEKIFTMKELFGGNQSEMDNILIALNGLSTFDEAKDVLMRSVAQKYEWGDAAKHNKAKNFIKLVHRRYN